MKFNKMELYTIMRALESLMNDSETLDTEEWLYGVAEPLSERLEKLFKLEDIREIDGYKQYYFEDIDRTFISNKSKEDVIEEYNDTHDEPYEGEVHYIGLGTWVLKRIDTIPTDKFTVTPKIESIPEKEDKALVTIEIEPIPEEDNLKEFESLENGYLILDNSIYEFGAMKDFVLDSIKNEENKKDM